MVDSSCFGAFFDYNKLFSFTSRKFLFFSGGFDKSHSGKNRIKAGSENWVSPKQY